MRRIVSVSRKLAVKTIKHGRPMTVRSVGVKTFPVIFDTLTNTHDIRASVAGFAELEAALFSFEVGLIMMSVTSKNLYKNQSGSDDP
jgi:hypothetical protein